MVINLWHNSAMDQWRWTLSNPKTLDQHSGTQEDIRDAMDDIANTVEYLMNEKNVVMDMELQDYRP
jgi:hypothetical protein|tara:strand:+ start:328 stop:525 length:198 start_codon:yes stop_codon:yes gene_type:complete